MMLKWTGRLGYLPSVVGSTLRVLTPRGLRPSSPVGGCVGSRAVLMRIVKTFSYHFFVTFSMRRSSKNESGAPEDFRRSPRRAVDALQGRPSRGGGEERPVMGASAYQRRSARDSSTSATSDGVSAFRLSWSTVKRSTNSFFLASFVSAFSSAQEIWSARQ